MLRTFLTATLLYSYLWAQSQSYSDSVAHYSRIIKYKPTSEAYDKRAHFRGIEGDGLGAISDLDEAIRLDPSKANLYATRGYYKSELKMYDVALPDLEMAIRLDPNNPLPYLLRGSARLWTGEVHGIVEDYSKCIMLSNPESKGSRPILREAYFWRGWYLVTELGMQKAGCLDMQKAAELGKNDAYKIIQQKCP